MKHRKLIFLTLLALLLVSVAPLAAQDDAPEGFPVTVIDGLGRELTFEEPPQRIACFYSGCMRGLGPLVVGTDITLGWPIESLDDEFQDEVYHPGLSDSVVVLPDGEDLDPETVAAFEPDLIIASSEEEVATYGSIAPVFSEYEVSSADEVFESFMNYARIVGLTDEAEIIAAQVQDRLAAYAALVPGDRTFMTVGNEGGGSLWVRTNNSSECLVLMGLATCNWPDPTGGEFWSFEATTETVLNLNPDVIYMANWSDEDTTDALLEDFINDPLIAETDAAQNGRIYNVDGYNNPTAQGIMALSQLLDVYMPLIYPEIFLDGPLTDEQVEEILAEAEGEATPEATEAPSS